jgi:plasmid replication initiation protein
MNENYLVTKANTLITSNYDLSLEEQRIILTLSSMVQPTDENFKPYEFKIKEFTEFLGIEDKRKYSKIPKITKSLMQKVLEIEQDDDIIQVAWLSSAHYRKGTGTVELEFSPKLKPYMLGLKEFYTSYRLKNVLELKGKYSIRMYEILKSNEFKKVCSIEVDELRKMLKADKGSYLIYQNFKNRIIIQAQKELKDKTDISFDFEEIKRSRKITTLKFYIKANKIKNKAIEEACVTLEGKYTNEEEKHFIELIREVKSIFQENIEGLEAKSILDTAKGDINIIKEKYEIAKVTPGIKGIVGWMCDAIKRDYQQIKGKVENGSFNDYVQRPFDPLLENKLLGWDGIQEDEVGQKYEQSTYN